MQNPPPAKQWQRADFVHEDGITRQERCQSHTEFRELKNRVVQGVPDSRPALMNS